jgi:hypothetical protein
MAGCETGKITRGRASEFVQGVSNRLAVARSVLSDSIAFSAFYL